MKLHGSEGVLLMEVASIKADGDNIHIKGKMMGQIPMTAVLRPQDLRDAMGMVSFSVIVQAIRMLFLRGDRKP